MSVANKKLEWINPLGGLGDALMLSGTLKYAIDADPDRKFNLVLRTKYNAILKGHPAIVEVGHPPPGAKFIHPDYWNREDYLRNDKRAYQIIGDIFGVQIPAQEHLYVPWDIMDEPLLMDIIPWKKQNILIAPSSDSPRKQMPLQKWESLVKLLTGEERTIVQVGKRNDRYVRGTFSLLGLTNPRQLIALIRHFDVVVTLDNFVMHAAHLHGIPAVVLAGPVDYRKYVYSEQVPLHENPVCSYSKGCLGPGNASLYASECPEGEAHCMNRIGIEKINFMVQKILAKTVKKASYRE